MLSSKNWLCPVSIAVVDKLVRHQLETSRRTIELMPQLRPGYGAKYSARKFYKN
jgi:hypothetical protein